MDINASTYSDYMMLISPPPEVIEGISKYKKASARLIGDFEGMYGKAHISLTSQYRQIPGLMMQKLDAYRKPVSSLNPVQLHINGFSFFKHGDTSATIYAKIELNAEVANWFIHLKRIFGDKNKTSIPHITVVKNIPVELFKTLWPKFTDQRYRYDFIPQSITILSRPMIGGREHYWTPFKELYFNNFR
ncbi:2'-5' RNA ligase family protein [Mucilaginibacter paludis]|uniref:Phosphoesterase HXTX n=1 Tax=Mucilaginibacter paludis DSM 18603 TaxID=714943 RepID=H1Y8X7_9SPHI|nr:2'-5' RNA ligase family protein [Mucilaginibacter paludis]EHQ28743.1 hypothetical protein Mucpa_4656 [Mucilaginibacter paludis DSM 18603]